MRPKKWNSHDLRCSVSFCYQMGNLIKLTNFHYIGNNLNQSKYMITVTSLRKKKTILINPNLFYPEQHWLTAAAVTHKTSIFSITIPSRGYQVRLQFCITTYLKDGLAFDVCYLKPTILAATMSYFPNLISILYRQC